MFHVFRVFHVCVCVCCVVWCVVCVCGGPRFNGTDGTVERWYYGPRALGQNTLEN